ncbi:acetylcholine receptor subunit alpha-type acr-16-like isoform X2 [Belonocnema kinseyi]|uniref:acetylcholine receptor subunit alpha-type acr-16-like isoform X2 n=1 Tax=Belonocnema kinseyi TaxID=2817044 RepID=UPI00143D8202|nr:acetylcholine receptor subunit alpha-type acr-16-like isoform X2 [Belonocnema kinseyi]
MKNYKIFLITSVMHLIIFFASFSSIEQYVLPGGPSFTPLWNETWTDKLKRDLLVKYDKFVRPAHHFNSTVVTLDIEIHHVSLDDMKSVLSVHCFLKMAWKDEKLKWNASEYGGLRQAHLGIHEVWQPDVVLYNSVAINAVEHYGDTHCLVDDDGTVFWVPPTQFLAFCDLDLRLWPFDTHTCSLKLGSWTYSGDQIDLHLFKKPMKPDLLVSNTEWKLLEMTRGRNVVHYECCPEPYVTLVFNLTLKRNALLYCNIVFTPTIPIVFLTLIAFWLPPQSEVRIVVAGCTALITSIFLIYFGNKIPPVSENLPLIVRFYSGCLYQVTIQLIISAVVLNFSKRPLCSPIPRGIRRLLLGWPGWYLGLSGLVQMIQQQKPNGCQELRESHGGDISTSNTTSNSFDDCDRENMITPGKNTTKLEWILLATAIDRLSFLLFCFIFIIMSLAFIT